MGSSESSGRGAGRSLGTLLLAALLVLSVAVFAGTRELRSEPDVVNSVVVTPEASTLGGEQASVRFELTRADDRADVLVIDDEGNEVRALERGAALEAGPHSYRWDLKAESGAPVPPGPYRLRVVLGEQGREIEPPGTIEVSG